MAERSGKIFLCSCERTMPVHPDAVAKACGRQPETADQLCRAERHRLSAALADDAPVTIACTQEAALFEDLAAEVGRARGVTVANVRETAGWSKDAADAGPKTAALIAAAEVEMPPIPLVTLDSRGIALILGSDEAAISAGTALADHLDITVVLKPGSEATPPRRSVFPVLQGRARRAKGHLGAFELTIDAFALPDPSSRRTLSFGDARDGAVSTCDLVVDLTGDPPLVPAPDLRPGYVRAHPGDPVGVARAILAASGLAGTFDKPRYVDFDAGLCAHSRSGIVGCTRCLDLCPTGAIATSGDSVSIDPNICAGCGQCAGVCPTGAASYALPPVSALADRLRAMLVAFAAAGGKDAVVLLHDGDHGEALIDAAARFGGGLPARVLPLAVNEVTQVGPEVLAAALAYGASAVRVLTRNRPRHDQRGLDRGVALVGKISAAYGFGARAVAVVPADDPDALSEGLSDLPALRGRPAPTRVLPAGTKRAFLELALRELHRVAPRPVASVALDEDAPVGAIVIDPDACTLCHACVSACPASALADDPDRPLVRFTETRCVQCGLCARSCPEDAITLAPRLDIPAWDGPPRVLHEEEPFACVRCGKPFATASAIGRVRDRLADHWMYAGPEGQDRRRVLEMCADCRVEAVVEERFDPHEPDIRRPRTTADYLRDRETDPE